MLVLTGEEDMERDIEERTASTYLIAKACLPSGPAQSKIVLL